MVCINKITRMVEDDLDGFYKDRERFKGMKMFIDFDASNYKVDQPESEKIKPKFKKKQKASKFVKPRGDRKSLF